MSQEVEVYRISTPKATGTVKLVNGVVKHTHRYFNFMQGWKLEVVQQHANRRKWEVEQVPQKEVEWEPV